MSKAKKIISMLLAVLMVMSVAPASVIASAVEPKATFKAPETSILTYSTDTSGTSEVIRVAGGPGLFTLGTTIVAATPSGIPKNDSGAYMKIAYDGETPEYPLVSFKIKGTKPTSNPTIVSSLGSNITLKSEAVGTQQADGSYLYTWRITGGNATQGNVVTYTITYYVEGNKEPQYAYAYSYVEDILVMNGYVAFKRLNNNGHRPATTHSNIVQFGGRNVYPGWYNDTAALNDRGFVNYGSGNALAGASLKGAGSESGMSTDSDGYVISTGATLSGTAKGVLIKQSYNQSGNENSTTINVAYGLDGNRTESKLYIDKRNETLQSLNVRVTLQAGEAGDGSDHGSGETGGNDSYPWPGTNLGGIDVLSGAISYGQTDSWNTVKAKSTSLISIGEVSVSSNRTSIPDNDNYGYIVSHFSGSGPSLQNGVTKYQNTLLVYAWETDTNGKGSGSNYETGAIGVTFIVYDTTDLYNIFYGIMAGKNVANDSSSYTCSDIIKYVANSGETPATSSNLTINFNKGAHPQAAQYSSGWDTFQTAYQNAGKILSKPDTNQTEINNAAVALINAYNGLGGFNSNVNYTIKHVKAGGSQTEIVNASTQGYTAAAQTGTVPAGTMMTAYAATIPGYTVSSDSVKTVTFSGKNANETITFEYTPVNVNINADTNNENLQTVIVDGEEKNLVIQYYPVPYGDSFNVATATNGDGTATRPGVGKKNGWEFVAWYRAEPADGVSWDESQRVTAPIQMSTLDPITIYARWDTAPVHMYATPMLDDGTVIGSKIDMGSVKPPANGSAVNFNRPAASVMTLEGYEFVGYYESYNNGFQGAVEFPVSFVIGDSDKQIVARYADVKNKIIFESNGGSSCADFNYEVGVPFTESDLPVPTRTGYRFLGWYKDVELSTPLFPEGTDSLTLNSATGFVVYAKWEAKALTVKFDTALGASTTKYDTKEITERVGVVGQVLPSEDVPANPRRFGYKFEGWLYNGRPFDFAAPLPVADDEITLVATWSKTDDSAFIELNAIEKTLGQEVYLDTDDSKDDDNIVQQGDVITVRMTSKTNFYVGSSLFIFMYDSSFYELVGSGKDAFTLNTEDSYIKGINARYTAVTNSDALPWPTDADSSTYNAVQIAIDPTVAANDYNCEPMDGKTWMVEFKLQVKDTADGEGTIYMDNSWTRTPDNIMGTMFYGWGASATTSVIDTENNKVTPDLSFASRTLKIDTEEPVKTTVNLNANGGAWANGDTTKTFANGNAGSEIAGYTKPERLGYTLEDNAWYAVAGDTTSAQWVEGYYPPEDTLTATYYANWTPKNYPVIFHWEQGSDEVYKEISVPYQTDITADAVANPSKQGYSFAGWTDAGGNLVTLPTQMNVADDNGYHLYATWVPASDIKFSIKVNYTLQNTGADQYMTQVKDKAGNNFQGMTGQRVALVEAIPANADPNTLYITIDQLAVVQSGNYLYSAALNTPDEFGHIDTGYIAGDGSLVLEVNYDAKLMKFTFNANGGKFADGKETLVKTGKFLAPFNGLADEELPTKDGYDFDGWNQTPAANFRGDLTYTAKWVAKKAHVRFMLNETEQYGTLIEVEVGKAPATPGEPSKAGWTFVGWNTDPAATTGVKVIPAVTTPDTAEGYAITYYAIFTKTPYTVAYYVLDPVTNDPSQIGETETYFMGDVVTVKGTDDEAIVKKGYTFSGWMINGSAAGATFEMEDANVEIYGTYTAKTINVKFYADEGAFASGEAFVEVATTFNETINVPAEAPKKDGYDFVGWAANADATSGSTALGTLTEEEASFYAVYAPQKHTYYIDVYEMGLDGQYPADPTRTETAEDYVDNTVEITSADNVTGFTLATPATQSAVVPATGELRFTVKYERNKYTINYIVEGAETPVEYFFGATIDAANEPAKVKKGHSFTGWAPAVPSTMTAGNMETVAQFSANSYTVTYYKDATKAEIAGTRSVVYDNDIPSIPTPDKTGYTFLGWAYEGTTDVVVSATSTVKISDSNVVLVGIWQVNQSRLNYIGASGVHEYFMVDYGTPAAEWPVPAVDPVKTGSYFDGWSESTYTTMPDKDVVVNIQAKWVVETYKFQFANTGDTTYGENNVITVTYGEMFDGVADPEWAGHVFAGWDKEIPTEIDDLGANGAVTVFTADWTVETYTLKFADTGDTAIADKKVTYGDTIDPVADPKKTGHVFAGWDVTPPTTIGDLGADKAVITYTAKWTKETYTLQFANTGDTTIADKTVKFGDTIAAVANPEWKGYVFAGWDVTPPTTIGDLGNDGAVIVYTAKWSLDQFTITFDADGGTAVGAITDDYTATVNAPTAPTKTGFVFSHWINIKDNATVAFPITMPAENLNLKAIWTAETYTVKFADTDDAGTVIEKNVTFGDTITVPSGLTKTGYVFAGWTDAEGNDATPPTSIGDLGENKAVITYTAKWTEKTYTLKFVDTGDTTIEDKIVKFGETIEVPTALTKNGQGYYFTGEWKDANGNAVTPPTTITDMGANNAEFTYVAQWAKETYTIAFDSNGGSAVESIVKQYGDVVSIPSNPTKTGHGFVQWNDAEGNKYDIQLLMPDLGENNATITLTAQWQKDVYTVKFYDAYGEIFTTATIEYDADIADYVPATLPEKEHYITLGWSTVQNDTVAIEDFGKMPANDKLAFYPVLERVKVTLALTEGTTAEIFEIDESNPELKVGFIRGLDTQLTKAALESTYLGVTGDGTVRVTPSWNAFNICGTGTIVEVIDNVEGKTIEVYYIVIYGDVNGDSAVNATDIPAINKEVLGTTSWSIEGDEQYDKAKVLAADLRDDGADAYVDGLDATLIRDVTLSVAYIDQTTGEVIYY